VSLGQHISNFRVIQSPQHLHLVLHIILLSNFFNQRSLWSIPSHNKINFRMILEMREDPGQQIHTLPVNKPGNHDDIYNVLIIASIYRIRQELRGVDGIWDHRDLIFLDASSQHCVLFADVGNADASVAESQWMTKQLLNPLPLSKFLVRLVGEIDWGHRQLLMLRLFGFVPILMLNQWSHSFELTVRMLVVSLVVVRHFGWDVRLSVGEAPGQCDNPS
jgi:hypothetical protein